MEDVLKIMKENWKYIALGTFFVLAVIFGDKANANNRDFPTVDIRANAAQMSVLLESNGATKIVKFQCNEISECAERLAERINTEGSCNPQVNKILIEKLDSY